MERWQPSDGDGAETRTWSGLVPLAEVSASDASPVSDIVDTTLLDVLPHPAFAVVVDGDDVFRFIYTNDAYRRLLGDDTESGSHGATGDLSQVVPANALVADVRAFARAAVQAPHDRIRDRVGCIDPDAPGRGRRDAARRRQRCVRATRGRRVRRQRTPPDRSRARGPHSPRSAHRASQPRDARGMVAGRAHHVCRGRARVGLVLLDIDHFKVVNDSLGHEAGDELLAAAASRLGRVLRSGDRLAVPRR